MNNFKNKKIAILGFGIEGESVANFLLKQNAKIVVFDEKEKKDLENKNLEEFEKRGIEFNFGKFTESFEGFDIIVRSPGVKFDSPQIQEALKKGIIVTSLTKIFFGLCPAKIIGVTGTKGKGTTSSLIYEMLKEQGIDVYLGGNIGTPALDFLDKLTSDSWVVLELSSFQLQDLNKSPHIGVLLMTTSEHLDYHKDINEYIESKRNMLRCQKKSDFTIINRDYPASRESDIFTEGKVYQFSREDGVLEGVYVENNSIWLKMSGDLEKIIDVKDIILPGKHNLENVCASVITSVLAGVSKQNIVKVLKSFKSLEHRLEFVATVGGVKYFNDSFSTTPETAIAAIETFSDPEILILGGSSKGSDFSDLGEIISNTKNIKVIIGIGKEWPRIKASFKIKNLKFKIFDGVTNMHEVVKEASKIAELGDVVILSPACASFDMFKDYKDRGNQFKKEVEKLKSSV